MGITIIMVVVIGVSGVNINLDKGKFIAAKTVTCDSESRVLAKILGVFHNTPLGWLLQDSKDNCLE